MLTVAFSLSFLSDSDSAQAGTTIEPSMSAKPTEMMTVFTALCLCPNVCHHGMKDDGTPIVQHSEKAGGGLVKTAHA